MTNNLPNPDPPLEPEVWLSKYRDEMKKLVEPAMSHWIEPFAGMHKVCAMKVFLNPDVAAMMDNKAIQIGDDATLNGHIDNMKMKFRHHRSPDLKVIDNGEAFYVTESGHQIGAHFQKEHHARVLLGSFDATAVKMDLAMERIRVEVSRERKADVVRPDGGGE